MKILVIGAMGQLGNDLLPVLSAHDVLSPPHDELDIERARDLAEYLNRHRPQAIVNTAAFHDVPRCESEPQRAFSVNATAVRDLARACREIGARFVHISTDYVFDGQAGRPYVEEDRPAPLMVYGASKLAGEHLGRAEHEDTIIVRTTGLFGRNPCRAKSGHSFVSTMLRLGREKGEVNVVSDQRCCPTYTVDLARQIATLLESHAPAGLYHAVNSPGLSWAELARLAFRMAGVDAKVNDISSAQFGASLRRPTDSRLACDQLARLGLLRMRPLEEALAEFLHEASLR